MNDSPVGCQNREVTEPQRELSPQATGGEKKAPLCKGGCRAERDWGIVKIRTSPNNPSVFAFGESTSLCTREATLSVTAAPCQPIPEGEVDTLSLWESCRAKRD